MCMATLFSPLSTLSSPSTVLLHRVCQPLHAVFYLLKPGAELEQASPQGNNFGGYETWG